MLDPVKYAARLARNIVQDVVNTFRSNKKRILCLEALIQALGYSLDDLKRGVEVSRPEEKPKLYGVRITFFDVDDKPYEDRDYLIVARSSEELREKINRITRGRSCQVTIVGVMEYL